MKLVLFSRPPPPVLLLLLGRRRGRARPKTCGHKFSSTFWRAPAIRPPDKTFWPISRPERPPGRRYASGHEEPARKMCKVHLLRAGRAGNKTIIGRRRRRQHSQHVLAVVCLVLSRLARHVRAAGRFIRAGRPPPGGLAARLICTPPFK